MNLQSAIKIVSNKFHYKADENSLLDGWSVMKEQDGKYFGDCEDFVLTVFWHISDKNLLKFLFNLFITHKYGLVWCKAVTGELHFVGRYVDLYFDNWTRAAFEKEEFFRRTGHRKLVQMFMPLCAIQIIKGIFKK